MSLQRSSGSRHLFGLGYDCSNHLLLHLHDVWITLHQGHARPHAAGIKSRWIDEQASGRVAGQVLLTPVPSVSDWGVRVRDLYEHRAQPEDHGRWSVLHPHSCHQRLWRSHGHLHLSCEKSQLHLNIRVLEVFYHNGRIILEKLLEDRPITCHLCYLNSSHCHLVIIIFTFC